MMISCAPVRDRRTLNDMEALMPEKPDSALAVLRGLQPRDLPGLHVRPFHALLLSEALDKNYIDLTDDSLSLAANRYYGEHGTKLHRLKSWYYLGRIRFNSGNYAEAVICYNKALEYAETLT
ncbi:MAG: tetratricopeptide repeat protein, partial [Bacteroidales bacterium]|nr:tetratricopeptide repeat protein [Bacteroidales bacterium]